MRTPDVTDPTKRAAAGWLRRLVSWLAGLLDMQPDILKALLMVFIVINGVKALYAIFSLLMWGMVYLAVKAS